MVRGHDAVTTDFLVSTSDNGVRFFKNLIIKFNFSLFLIFYFILFLSTFGRPRSLQTRGGAAYATYILHGSDSEGHCVRRYLIL
jgi:hypothetical protein